MGSVDEVKERLEESLQARHIADCKANVEQALMELKQIQRLAEMNLISLTHDIIIWPDGITGLTAEQMQEKTEELLRSRPLHDRDTVVTEADLTIMPMPTVLVEDSLIDDSVFMMPTYGLNEQ